ncbi:MAG TPA: hypothetical protein VHQ65_13720 [Thermoanaerobaculia bacterium]|nr:hypothetical protein [Thermoanaerobaculia bacterium]
MQPTIEERIGLELGRRLAARGVAAAALERSVGLPAGAVEQLVLGRESLDLGRLERVLSAVGTTPSEFFAALYGAPPAAPAPAPAAGTAAVLGREEVEHLVRDVRTALRTLLAELAEEG